MTYEIDQVKSPHAYVRADFNALFDCETQLQCPDMQAALDRQGITLTEGLRVVCYDYDRGQDGEPLLLIADGTIAPDREPGRWLAIIDLRSFRHAPMSHEP